MRRVVVDRAGTEVGSAVAVADSWWLRLRGLLGRPRMRDGEGMLLLGSPSVHTAGMTYDIDVAFLDEDGLLVKALHRLRPWRLGFGGGGAAHALELPAGRIREIGLTPGDRLHWS